MKPAVRYQGGKRWAAPIVVEWALGALSSGDVYTEPFVGMGGVYLALRFAGYDGPAALNDLNPAVAAFWRCLHDDKLARETIAAMRPLAELPRENASFLSIATAPPPDREPALAAAFMYLQMAGFSGKPCVPRCTDWKHHGSSLDYEARRRAAGGRAMQHDFMKRIRKFEQAHELVRGLECAVSCGSYDRVERRPGFVYLDPPYPKTTGYSAGATPSAETLADDARARAQISHVMLSDAGAVTDLLPSWRRLNVRTRAKSQQMRGGNKREVLVSSL